MFKYFPQYPLIWSIVSVVLTTAEDNHTELAFDRMKANLLGGAVGLLLYFIPVPGIFLICAGVLITILLGNYFSLKNCVRSAEAGLVIVFIQEKQVKQWDIALERIVCVLLGCFVALGITLCFNFFKKIRFGKKGFNIF